MVSEVAQAGNSGALDADTQQPVEVLVHSRFPGLALESPVQGWAYLQEFAQGIRAYNVLVNPTAEDDRWLGVCYFQLLDDQKALDAFFRAVQRGDQAAKINLAQVLRFLDRGEEAARELTSIRPESLNSYDHVFYLRIVSVHEENNGNLRAALKAAEEAWRRVQGIPEYPILAPSILSQLGTLHSRNGRAQRALWFLERAIQTTDGLEHLKSRLRRAAILNTLGRHREASAELETLLRHGVPRSFLPELYCYRGEIAWSGGHLDAAKAAFQDCITECVAVTRELQFTFEEFIARLSMVAIYCTQDHLSLDEARAHLARAQGLASDKSDRLHFRYREIYLLWCSRDYATEHALAELTALDEEFEEMGLLQEQAVVKLHRAGLLNEQSSDRTVRVLEELQGLTVTLQNQAFLTREWGLFPSLRRFARKTHPGLLGDSLGVLQLHTLGEERILLAGDPINIPLRRGVEILAYFLEHKAVSLNQLLLDIFPEEKPRSAKSYFHQFRHQLKEHIDGVEIEYDRESRLYMLKSEIDILWDVAELRAGRRSDDVGLFLPSSGTDWALTVDHSLERYRSEA